MKISSRIYPLAIRVLSHRIARLNTSKRRGVGESLVREALLRTRALLLSLNHAPARDRLATWRLVLLLDPVAAGVWPHLRRRKGLNLTQVFARWLVARANPSAREAVSSVDLEAVGQLLRSLQSKLESEKSPSPRREPIVEQADCASLESPYPIGGNTNLFYMTYIV